MANTTAQDVYDSFESIFSDKKEIPESLELQWLKTAIGRYNIEIAIDDTLTFDSGALKFNTELPQYVIDTLGQIIRQLYQEREFSRVNKIASIVGNELSVNSGMSLSRYSKEELEYHSSKASEMIENQKPTAMI